MQKIQGNEKILITEEAVLLIFAKDFFYMTWNCVDVNAKKENTLWKLEENLKLFTVFIMGKKTVSTICKC